MLRSSLPKCLGNFGGGITESKSSWDPWRTFRIFLVFSSGAGKGGGGGGGGAKRGRGHFFI